MSTQMPEDVRSTVTAEPHAPSQTPAPAPRRPHRRPAAVVAGIAVVATAVTVLWSTSPEQPPRDPAPVGSAEPETVDDAARTTKPTADEITRRLVNEGYLPAEAYDAELAETRRLQNEGLIPREAHDADLAEMRRLQNEGLIPRRSETSEGEPR
jgi:hypothetical protein